MKLEEQKKIVGEMTTGECGWKHTSGLPEIIFYQKDGKHFHIATVRSTEADAEGLAMLRNKADDYLSLVEACKEMDQIVSEGFTSSLDFYRSVEKVRQALKRVEQ